MQLIHKFTTVILPISVILLNDIAPIETTHLSQTEQVIECNENEVYLPNLPGCLTKGFILRL